MEVYSADIEAMSSHESGEDDNKVDNDTKKKKIKKPKIDKDK